MNNDETRAAGVDLDLLEELDRLIDGPLSLEEDDGLDKMLGTVDPLLSSNLPMSTAIGMHTSTGLQDDTDPEDVMQLPMPSLDEPTMAVDESVLRVGRPHTGSLPTLHHNDSIEHMRQILSEIFTDCSISRGHNGHITVAVTVRDLVFTREFDSIREFSRHGRIALVSLLDDILRQPW